MWNIHRNLTEVVEYTVAHMSLKFREVSTVDTHFGSCQHRDDI